MLNLHRRYDEPLLLHEGGISGSSIGGLLGGLVLYVFLDLDFLDNTDSADAADARTPTATTTLDDGGRRGNRLGGGVAAAT